MALKSGKLKKDALMKKNKSQEKKRQKHVVFKSFACTTTKPFTLLKEIEKVLRRYCGEDWFYNFNVE